jgi:hypothetical protein
MCQQVLDGWVTQVRLFQRSPIWQLRSRQSQRVRFSPSNLPSRKTAAAVSDGRVRRRDVSCYECDCYSCACHKRNEVLTSRKRFATLSLFSTIKRFHSLRVETVFLCFF